MNNIPLKLTSYALALAVSCSASLASAATIQFSGLTWEVRSGSGGPGPNNWSPNNVFVDSNGWLHLKITNAQRKWYCAEIYTNQRFGFGQYWFYTIGRVDTLDPNVVLGLFHYPTSDVGPDGTNEIDVEFAKWGQTSTSANNGSFTAWPAVLGPGQTSNGFKFSLNGDYTTHGYTWRSNSILFQSGEGHYADYRYPIQQWLFSPSDPLKRIAQKPMPLHINIWLFNGKPPKNNLPVEIIIKKVCFKSDDGTVNTCPAE